MHSRVRYLKLIDPQAKKKFLLHINGSRMLLLIVPQVRIIIEDIGVNLSSFSLVQS